MPFLGLPLCLGARRIKGLNKWKNLVKAFGTEFAIGAGSETFIQPFVTDWKAKLNSPYSLKEAVINILAVGGGASALVTFATRFKKNTNK